MSNDLTEQVITQVKSRPVLWDKKHELYGNIQAMDYEWNKLSMLLKRDKEFLKKRWRRLRDVFRIEMKKLKVPENPTQPLISYYTGFWVHFKSMFFLKDCLTKRTPRLFFPEENEEAVDDPGINTATTPNETDITETSIQDIQEASPDEEPEEFEEKYSVWIEDKSESKGWSEEQEERGVKRKAEDSNWETALDEDVNFAKSIVGYLRRLNPIKKLMVRNEIQNILLRELLCDTCRCKGQQKVCSCDSSC